MIHLVVLAIPQFLLYTFPFASLSGASMVIGDLTSSNEILALRSSGFSMSDIYRPIIFFSIIISIFCFLIADILMPYSASQYKQLYIQLVTKTPGVELKSYSSKVFNDFLITNGQVKDNKIDDIIILRSYDKNESILLSSKSGVLNILDVDNLIYSLDLSNPKLIFSNNNTLEHWQIANAKQATYYIDFSDTLSSVSANIPSNLSSVDLITKINSNKKILKTNTQNANQQKSETVLNLAKSFYSATDQPVDSNYSFVDEYNYYPNINTRPIDFYLQYFRAELNKKFALSAACFFLILITIPLSFLKFKHGRLVGFAISMFVAVIYWYLLFFAQLQTFKFPLNPLFLMWAPNIVILIASLILIRAWRN